MIKEALNDARERMEKSLKATQGELNRLRTGRASPSLLDTVRVEYYGSMMPLNQVANISIPEPRMIQIQPWDKTLLSAIEKAILQADIGITPQNNGQMIRLPIPPLTEERRKELVRLVHQLAEEGKIAIRNIRRDVLESLKKARKASQISEDEEYNAGIDVQELTDEYIEKIDEIVKAKEREIMEV